MKYKINRKENYSLASITTPGGATVSAYITADLHSSRNSKVQATELMIGDALLSGAGKYNRDQFLSAVNLLGASLKISLADSYLNIKLSATEAVFPKLLKLVEVMLNEPTFAASELKRIKNTTVNELTLAKENSKAISHQQLKNKIYGRTDRRHSSSIDEVSKVVKTITSKDLKSLHQSALHQQWYCSIIGSQKTVSDFSKTVARLKKARPRAKAVVGAHEQKPPAPVSVLTNIPTKQNIDFSIGAPLPFTLHHPDYIPLNFGVAVLAKWGGFAGRLMSTVREKEGLTYGIYGKLSGFTGTEQGYWQIMTFFAPDKTVQALRSTFREVTKLYESGITKDELLKFKKILGTQQTLIKDSPASLLANLHDYHCQDFTLEEMQAHKDRLTAVTQKEVNDAIKKYLDPKKLTVSGAGPVNSVKKAVNDFRKSVS